MVRFGLLYQLLVISFSVFTLGCLPGDSTAAGNTTVVTPPADSSNIVCDPFGNGSGANQGHGITSNLYYLTDSQPRYGTVEDNINFGVRAPVTLYLNDINVPTRPFDQGFFTQAGSLITDADGNALYEYFALQMQTDIALGPDNAEGDYQFAILSDDGAVLNINDTGGGFRTLIDDNQVHPTRMGCETDRVTLSQGSRLPAQYNYFQGPRYHIASVLMWRPYPTDPNQVTDPLCGQEGNNLFFDPTQTPSAPSQNYADLLSRGWQPLQPANYYLPQAVGPNNPCTAANPDVISNVQILNLSQTSATFSWTTSQPATSYVNVAAYPSTNYTLVGDNNLTTAHSFTVNTLADFTVYTYFVSSTDSSGTQVTSAPTTFRTLR